jgi:hypothetical protein
MFQLALASKFYSEVLRAFSRQHSETHLMLGISLHDLCKNEMMMYFIYCLFNDD